ncbi:hypothetical protein TNIN_247111 [Trichonephila inaurata madagascariensis]|uniref:Uncharacterized protein n=1 Tax=Trichonephila inaurata madagascariensis TaxID=2747483 RepID=A0A8X6X616_9ARAC|nr:hypothetical protein TNIN_247111 [Trichonephila inaurata madagascariensis]
MRRFKKDREKKGSFPPRLGSGCQDMIFPFYELPSCLPPYREVNMDTRNLSLALQCNLRSRALTPLLSVDTSKRQTTMHREDKGADWRSHVTLPSTTYTRQKLPKLYMEIHK